MGKSEADFIEEIEAEGKPEEAQIAIRSSLRKELNKYEALRNDLIGLLRQVEEKELTGKGNVNISNSKNVVQGSEIKVGGDFRVGDETHYH